MRKRLMYRVILCTLIMCIVVAACGGKATPDPTEVARAVEATLAAQVPTATPIPTYTSSPTATPTATPATLVPAGWKQCEDVDGLFTFMYPPDWEISSQTERQIIFGLPGRSASAVVSIDVGEDFDAVGTNDEGILTRLAAMEADALTAAEVDDVKLLDKDIWKDQGYLLEYTFRDDDAEGMEYVIYVPFGLGRYTRLGLIFFRLNGTVMAEELGALDTLLSTLRVNQPITSEPSKLTITPRPTDTPKLTPTSQPTLSPADTVRVRVAIEKVLGSSNRQGVKRISSFSLETGPDPQVFVEWAINDNLTEGLIKSSAQLDVTSILEAIAKSGVKYGSVRVQGTFSMVDKSGNAQEMVVIKAVYTRATVERINWDDFLFANVYDIADTKTIHPAFQK